MKHEKNDQLKQLANQLREFKKIYKAELDPVNKRYKKAVKEYETSMKNFVVKHITGRKYFKEAWNNTLDRNMDLYNDLRLSDILDNKEILDSLICDHLWDMEYEIDELKDDIEELNSIQNKKVKK